MASGAEGWGSLRCFGRAVAAQLRAVRSVPAAQVSAVWFSSCCGAVPVVDPGWCDLVCGGQEVASRTMFQSNVLVLLSLEVSSLRSHLMTP
ncbi:MAG: hypothetical protein JWM15_2051 [Cryptosporangiaceae bacterium]|jgi:hypothetical protein|nr:hypothetical protein [Cryptosporangiaceae bacterium]